MRDDLSVHLFYCMEMFPYSVPILRSTMEFITWQRFITSLLCNIYESICVCPHVCMCMCAQAFTCVSECACPCYSLIIRLGSVVVYEQLKQWVSMFLTVLQLMGNQYGSWQAASWWLPWQPHWAPSILAVMMYEKQLLFKPSLSVMASLIGAMHKWIRINQACYLGGIHCNFSSSGSLW